MVATKTLLLLSLAGTARGDYCQTLYYRYVHTSYVGPPPVVEYEGKCFMLGRGSCNLIVSTDKSGTEYSANPGFDMELAPQSYMPAVGPLLQELTPRWAGKYRGRLSSSCCIWHRDAATEGMAYVVANPRASDDAWPPQLTGGSCPRAGCREYNREVCGELLQRPGTWQPGPFHIWHYSEAPAAKATDPRNGPWSTGWDPCPAQSEPIDDQFMLCMTRSVAPPPAPAACGGEGAWVLANYPGHTVGTPADYDNIQYDTGEDRLDPGEDLSCPKTCAALGRIATGARYVCNVKRDEGSPSNPKPSCRAQGYQTPYCCLGDRYMETSYAPNSHCNRKAQYYWMTPSNLDCAPVCCSNPGLADRGAHSCYSRVRVPHRCRELQRVHGAYVRRGL